MRSIRLHPLQQASSPTWIARGVVSVVAAMSVTIGGCNRVQKMRPGWANVSGTVTYRGKPVPGGEVMWCTAKDGISVARGGRIKEDGTFALDTPTGPATIAIQAADLKKTQPGRYVEIPAKYADALKSGLTYEAKEGDNKNVNLDLK